MKGSTRVVLRRFGPEILVVALAAVLVLVARGRWVTTLGDHGIGYSQLEGLWRGKRVMRDIPLPYGPLSIVVLRELIRPFPRSVATVAIAEFALGLAAAVGIVRFSAGFLRERERLVTAALLATIVFWIPGEGSLLYPYTPAVSIGFLLALSAMGLARRVRATRLSPGLALVAGLVAGLAYLTKQEMGAAAALGVAAVWIANEDGKAVFARGTVAGTVFFGTVAAGYRIFGVDFRALFPFAPIPPRWRAQYAGVTGMDDPAGAFLTVISAAGAIVAAAAGAAALSSIRRGGAASRAAIRAVVAGAAVSLVAGRFQRVAILAIAPAAVAGGLVYGWVRRRSLGRERAAALLSLSAAAVPLLTRVGWRGWSDGPFTAIGYSLALPVTVFVVARLYGAFQAPAGGGDLGAAGAGILVLLSILLALPALFRIGRWPEPAVPVSTPRGSVFVPPGWAKTFGKVRDDVNASTSPKDEVFFLPQSHGLNFLLDRDSPVPGLKLDPAIDEIGEGGLIGALARRPPLLVVIFDENSQIYDSGGYGSRYGRQLESWIESRYRVVNESERSGIGFRIMKLADRAPSSGGRS